MSCPSPARSHYSPSRRSALSAWQERFAGELYGDALKHVEPPAHPVTGGEGGIRTRGTAFTVHTLSRRAT